MHADAFPIDESLARELLAAQFPQWADLPLRRIDSTGTDNALFALGPELYLRMPMRPSAVPAIQKEVRWLGRFAGLPLKTPTVVASGRPGAGYPSDWAVMRWLNGESLEAAPLVDQVSSAVVLAKFLRALHAVDTAGAPPSGEHNYGRGEALAARDEVTCQSIAGIADLYPQERLIRLWQESLAVPEWPHPPVWVHGDIHAGNLLAQGQKLSAVIDFGLAGVGDPAVDLLPAWSLFDTPGRNAFRTHLGLDDDTWKRGAGWALSTAVVALAYYRGTNPSMEAMSVRVIDAVLG